MPRDEALELDFELLGGALELQLSLCREPEEDTAARALLKRTTEMNNAAQGRPALGVRRSAGLREREAVVRREAA